MKAMRTLRFVRTMTVVGAACVVTRLIWWLAQAPIADLARERPWTLSRIVVDTAAVLTLLLWVVLVVMTATSLLSVVVPTLALRRWPAAAQWWRRGVLALCGIGLTAQSGLTVGALAADSDVPAAGSHPCHTRCTDHLAGLPLPDFPVTPDRRPPSVAYITVRAGDCLWRIAARHHRGASAAELAGDVERLYRLNRDVIGPDPNLIFPGTVLIAPGGNP